MGKGKDYEGTEGEPRVTVYDRRGGKVILIRDNLIKTIQSILNEDFFYHF